MPLDPLSAPSPAPLVLYPFQAAVPPRVYAAFEAGLRRVLLAAPTGSGKTVLACFLIRAAALLGQRCLFLAHRKELIDQASKKLDVAGIDHGVIMADHPRRKPEALVQVASVPTLMHREKPRAELVIVDECFPAGVVVGAKPIEQVRVGEWVPSFDEATGQFVEGRVTGTFSSMATQLVRVVASGASVVCTPGHPFWTQRGWVPAEQLSDCDAVLRCGYWAGVDSVEMLDPGADGTFGGACPGGRVFNLEVEGTHAYVAGGFVVHNCHHLRAESYQSILEACLGALLVGLTATPWRSDGKGLQEMFDALVLVATPAQLIAQGYLVPFEGFSFDAPDLSRVNVRGGDYDEDELAKAVNTRRIVGGLVERWWEFARHLLTVVFAVNVAHSKAIVAAFLAAGIAAEHLDGTMSNSEREAILARLASGETQVVSNCAVLSEGWDMPECACCILARPTQSLVLYLQQVGRVLRKAAGKTHARIHDHAGLLTRFGLPDADRDYSLCSDMRNATPAEVAVQTCPLCARVYPASARRCPDCYDPEAVARPAVVVETDGHLVEIAELRLLEELRRIPGQLLERKAAEYLRLKEEATRNGYKPGWAYYRYRETFHEEPRFPPGLLAQVRPAAKAFGPEDHVALLGGGRTP